MVLIDKMELNKAVILSVGFMLAVCSGLPANKKDEVEQVRPVKTYGDQPIVDTGIFSGWDNPFSSNPFGGIFDNLEGIMDRMRQQIASLLNRFPLARGSNSTDDISSFPTAFDHPHFPAIGGIDLSKGNSTSITKVIDGHTVVINETEYKNEDDFGGTFFKVRIIDVKPDSSELTTEKEAEAVPDDAPAKDREEVANSIENEISKSKEAEVLDNAENQNNLQKSDNYQNIETFDEVAFENTDGAPTTFSNRHRNSHYDYFETQFSTDTDVDNFDTEWNNISPVKPLDFNAIDSKENEIPSDLSRDTLVNEILAKNGAHPSVNPDAEVFVVENFEKKINS